jgi:hypothetical protein
MEISIYVVGKIVLCVCLFSLAFEKYIFHTFGLCSSCSGIMELLCHLRDTFPPSNLWEIFQHLSTFSTIIKPKLI